MTIKIFHASGTRSIRVIWVCEELGLDYERVDVDFSVAFRQTPEWRAMNPVGKVPVMLDGDLKLFESGAMVQYLLDHYGDGRLQPVKGTPAHGLYMQWSWFAEATFARPLGEIVNHRRVFTEAEQSAAAIAEMQDRAWLCVEAIEQALTDSPYLPGPEFSGADIMMGYSLMLTTRLVGRDFPHRTDDYWHRLSNRPAFIAAMR